MRYFFVIFILCISSTSFAGIYKCKQTNGSIKYSSIPCAKENKSMIISTLPKSNNKNSIKEIANIVTKTVSNTIGSSPKEGKAEFSRINHKLVKVFGKSFNEIVFTCIKEVKIEKKHHYPLVQFFNDINNAISHGQNGISKQILDKHPKEIVVIGLNISKYCAMLPFDLLKKVDS